MKNQDLSKKRYPGTAVLAVLLFLAVCAALYLFPYRNMISPSYTSVRSFKEITALNSGTCVSAEFSDLFPTGYENENGVLYMYGQLGDGFVLMALTPETASEAVSGGSVTVNGMLEADASLYNELSGLIADELNWSPKGLSEVLSPMILIEKETRSWFRPAALALLFLALIISLMTFRDLGRKRKMRKAYRAALLQECVQSAQNARAGESHDHAGEQYAAHDGDDAGLEI